MLEKQRMQKEDQASLQTSPRCRVLCVDDHPATLKLYDVVFKREGFAATLAATIKEARQQFGTQSFDLFILDSMIDPQTGASLCQEVRASHPEAAILVVSGRSRPQDREQALAAGANDFLLKPVSLEELQNKAKELVEGKCTLG